MLLQVDPKTLGANLFLLLGLAIVLGVAILLALGIWTGAKMWLDHRREHRAWLAHTEGRLAPDGRPYPPQGQGICDQCGRADTKIYYPETGRELCPDCFEEDRRAKPNQAAQ